VNASPSFDCCRDRHLFGPGRKRVLALDGGGVRGAISVAFLERIEALLAQNEGREVRLGDAFDLVGGTSTEAIIAGALALGYTTAQVKDIYLRLAPFAFRPRWHIPVAQAKFDARGLRGQIDTIVRDRDLGSHDLITGLGVITKHMDTGAPWILSNNPRAPYWNDGIDRDGKPYIGNKHYKLANLVRASTAAPHYFDPEILPIGPQPETLPDAIAAPFQHPFFVRLPLTWLTRFGVRHKMIDEANHGLFVDGGVTPHNNPSLALLQMTQLKPFGLGWPTGPEKITIVSVGTGSGRAKISFENLGYLRYPKLALHALRSMMTDAEMMVLALMQWWGECPAPWEINSEIGTLAGDGPPGGKLFRFFRYDVQLEAKWLASELDVKVTDREVERFRRIDDTAIVDEICQIARIAAERQVKAEHWVEKRNPV
jgi:uncharacterized protein